MSEIKLRSSDVESDIACWVIWPAPHFPLISSPDTTLELQIVFVYTLDASPEAAAISSLVLPRQLLLPALWVCSFAYTDGFFSQSPHSVIRRPCHLFLQTIHSAISTIPVSAGGTAEQHQAASKASYLAPLIQFLPCHWNGGPHCSHLWIIGMKSEQAICFVNLVDLKNTNKIPIPAQGWGWTGFPSIPGFILFFSPVLSSSSLLSGLLWPFLLGTFTWADNNSNLLIIIKALLIA